MHDSKLAGQVEETTTGDEWWTPAEAAKYLGVVTKTIRRIEARDPTFPRGKRLSERTVRYSARRIRAWLAATGANDTGDAA